MTMWRPITGFEGWYEVSDTGLVRSLMWNGARGPHPRPAPRIMSPKNVRGYLSVHLVRNRVTTVRAVHHLVLEAFVGPRSDGAQADHINCDPGDNRACNLRWVTPAENSAHRVEVGHQVRGEAVPNSKLTVESVREARRLRADGWTWAALAQRYGVSAPGIRYAVTGRTWAHA
jgi:hypothetical protein